AELDRYVPNDAEAVRVIDVKQLRDSAVVKKYGLEKLQTALENNDKVHKVLGDFGIDPLKDIDRFVSASGPGPQVENELYVVYGRFNREKIEAKAEQIAKDKPDQVKIQKAGDVKYAEVNTSKINPLLPTLLVCLLDDNTLIASGSKDYL